MITYVNTVLVGKGKGVVEDPKTLAGKETKAAAIAEAGKMVVESIDDSKFRVGLVTGKTTEAYINGKHTYSPIVRWSNEIKIRDIKGMAVTNYADNEDSEEIVTIDLSEVKNIEELAEGSKRVILKLTYKDLPTRFRKWTESYEYVTAPGDDATAIAKGLESDIMRNYKRARIDAKAEGDVLTLTALPYDDDDTVDSISPANKVRFSASMWYTDPQAAGFASKNKYALVGAKIEKTPGVQSVGNWKVVRDAESQAMGYMGILNRGECTWPIIKPEMNVEIGQEYDTLTLEFENMYRAADDIFRKTKQTLQVFEPKGELTDVISAIAAIVEGEGGEDDVIYNNTKETAA